MIRFFEGYVRLGDASGKPCTIIKVSLLWVVDNAGLLASESSLRMVEYSVSPRRSEKQDKRSQLLKAKEDVYEQFM